MDRRVGIHEHVTHTRCSACRVRESMVCFSITLDDLSHTCIDDLTIRRGETIFRRGAPSSSIYFVRSGFVKLVRYSSIGGQRILRVINRGGVVGMEAAFSPSFEHTAIAMDKVVACRIPAAGFRRMLQVNPALQHRLLEQSHRALTEAWDWMSELSGSDTPARVRMAKLLLRLRDGECNRIYRFSLADVGAILGIAVETACRILSEFKCSGLLTQPLKGYVGERVLLYDADICGLQNIANEFDGQG